MKLVFKTHFGSIDSIMFFTFKGMNFENVFSIEDIHFYIVKRIYEKYT